MIAFRSAGRGGRQPRKAYPPPKELADLVLIKIGTRVARKSRGRFVYSERRLSLRNAVLELLACSVLVFRDLLIFILWKRFGDNNCISDNCTSLCVCV